jgi:outer membrane lipoprotein-sorting protein
MEKIRYEKWTPIKVKRKKDGKVILAMVQQQIYKSLMLWDGDNQWMVTPGEDEISIPTPKEIAIIEANVNKWKEHLFKPSVTKTETKPKFEVTETKVEKPNKVSSVLDTAKNILDEIKETPALEPKKVTDFELLTADIASV